MKVAPFALGALALVPLHSVADGVSVVDPSVVSVVTEGYWRSGDLAGTYRVIVRSGGFEHVSSEVTAEWVAEPAASAKAQTIVASKTLVGGGAFSLGAPVVERIRSGVRVKLSGVRTYKPAESVACIFELGPVRIVVIVAACK